MDGCVIGLSSKKQKTNRLDGSLELDRAKTQIGNAIERPNSSY